MLQIIPAILAKTEEELKPSLDRVKDLNEELHIDYADGRFVTDKTVDWQILLDMPNLYFENLLELHIMALEPLAIAKAAADAGFAKVIVHGEALKESDLSELQTISEYIDINLALNPESSIKDYGSFLKPASGVTILTVNPGKQGNPFQEKALSKVNELKELGFSGIVEVDGGITNVTVPLVKKVGIERVIVGSYLMQAADPGKAYEELEKD